MGERRVRTMFLTYEAEDDAADTFMVVLGSIAENFRGVRVVEFQDDTVFSDGEDAMAALHELVSAAPLTAEQRRQLEEFSEALADWSGEESG